ncbi:MAG: hypothetical protein WBF42_10750, partial [Terracidiphilus sp.]
SGQLTISLPAGITTYSVAYACPLYGTDEQEFIQFHSLEDGSSIYGTCLGAGSSAAPPMGTLTGSVDASAFPSATNMQIEVSTSSYAQIAQLPVGALQVSGPTGTDRVLIGLYDSSYLSLLAIKAFNNQAVPGALNAGHAVTFISSDATTLQPITFANVPAGFSSPFVSAWALGVFMLSNGVVTQYPQLPSGVMQSGDFYSLQAVSTLGSGAQTSAVGSVLYPAGGPATLTFPAPWSTGGPTAASLPVFTFDYEEYAGKSGVSDAGTLTWLPTSGQQAQIFMTASGNYMGSTTSLAVPDLSSVGGFLAPPASGMSIFWSEMVSQGTFPSTTSLAGGSATYVSAEGSYTVP